MLRLGSSWQKWWNWRPLLLHGDSRLQLAVRNELDTSSARGNFHPGHGDGGFRGDRGRFGRGRYGVRNFSGRHARLERQWRWRSMNGKGPAWGAHAARVAWAGGRPRREEEKGGREVNFSRGRGRGWRWAPPGQGGGSEREGKRE